MTSWSWRALRLAKHPGKTFIGRIEKGFDFLGYHFSPQGLTLARQTIENFLERAIRLYEQEPGEETAPVRLGAYVRRWEGWARSGFAGCVGYAYRVSQTIVPPADRRRTLCP